MLKYGNMCFTPSSSKRCFVPPVEKTEIEMLDSVFLSLNQIHFRKKQLIFVIYAEVRAAAAAVTSVLINGKKGWKLQQFIVFIATGMQRF